MLLMATVLILLVLQVCQAASISKEIGENCTTPLDESGECRNLKNCPVLLELVRGNHSEGAGLLRDSRCGFDGLDSLVCCPGLSSRLPPWEYNNYPKHQQQWELPSSTTRRPPSGALWGFSSTSRPSSGQYTSTSRPFSSSSGQYTSTSRPSSSFSSSSGQYTSTTGECGKQKVLADKIVGGETATLGSWPWLAALGYRSRSRGGIEWLCGGALVTNRHVITAAHCVVVPTDKTLSKARLGDLDLDDEVQDGASPIDVDVESATPHTSYKSNQKVNDIAVVKLRTAVRFTDHIQPICLPSNARLGPLEGQSPYVAGWGALFFRGPSSKELQQVAVEVTDEASCREAYRSQRGAVIDQRVLCAGKDGKDACQGDSGGPLMLLQGDTYYLVGVVSYGKNCAEPGYPGIYSRVSAFMDFLNSNLR